MEALDQIIEPVREPMARFEGCFAEALGSGEAPLCDIMGYLLDPPGKRLRPLLVFLTASLFGDINERTFRVATFVEMLHTATLLHDDVVDGDTERRGKPSVNVQWNNLIAVLAGDYLFAKALLTLSNPDDSAILSEMLHTSLTMSEGELIQNQKQIESSLGKEEYLDIITHKTAMLMRSCCVAGAMSVIDPLVLSAPSVSSASPSSCPASVSSSSCFPSVSCAPSSSCSSSSHNLSDPLLLVGDFGLNLGLVFQMRDDLLDADDPAATAWAEQLLPEYTTKTLASLDALASFLDSSFSSYSSSFQSSSTPYSSSSPHSQKEIFTSLRSLVLFCANRSI